MAAHLSNHPCRDEDSGYAVEEDVTMLLAVAVRNAMEGFHVKHLSDTEMAELNPIIRNALFTCLVAMREAAKNNNERAAAYLRVTRQLVEIYWEPPSLLEDFSPSGPWAGLSD